MRTVQVRSDDQPHETLLTIPEVALRLKCSERTVWRLIKDEELPSVFFRKLRRVKEKAVDELINRNGD